MADKSKQADNKQQQQGRQKQKPAADAQNSQQQQKPKPAADAASQQKDQPQQQQSKQQQQPQQQQRESTRKPRGQKDDAVGAAKAAPSGSSGASTAQDKQAAAEAPAKPTNRLHSHLDAFIKQEDRASVGINQEGVHPAITQLGLHYADGTITGSTARCIAMLNALKEVITDYKTPENKELRRDLDSKLKPMIDYLKFCRPMSVSMGNALKHFKLKLHHLNHTLPEAEVCFQIF